jgi:hypothetical protein
MIAVIFENWPFPDKTQTCLDMGAALGAQVQTIDGFMLRDDTMSDRAQAPADSRAVHDQSA